MSAVNRSFFMAKIRAKKEQEMSDVVNAMTGAKGVVFANFAGIDVSSVNELRRRCRQAGVKYGVSKKTLLKKAFEQVGITDIDPKTFPGGLAVVFGYEDEVAAARILKDFAKDHESLKFVGGLIPEANSWRFLDVAEVSALSKLPGKQELIGQVVGTIAAPLRGFVSVLAGPSRSLVQVLSAISQAKN